MQTPHRFRLPRLSVAKILRTLWVGLCLLFVAACHLDMYDQPAYWAYEGSGDQPAAPFANGASAQRPVGGTVARGQAVGTNGTPALSDPVLTGRQDGQDIQQIPLPVTDALLARGRDRYGVYCVPCHGALGNGKGLVGIQFRPGPASFYTDRLKSVPAGYIFGVITNGKGLMYPYGSRITAEDRWAIVAYVRQLQQNPPPGVKPEEALEPTPPAQQSQHIPFKTDPTLPPGR